jgi:hypothetical protein
MRDTVYDTSFVAYSNGELAGRRANNALDRRLSKIEEFVEGKRIAWYNEKLFREYRDKVRTVRNDVIEMFLIRLADAGKQAARNRLSTANYAKARKAQWPSHDQHLLAAAIEGTRATIFVTEKALEGCGKAVKREFGFTVVRIAYQDRVADRGRELTTRRALGAAEEEGAAGGGGRGDVLVTLGGPTHSLGDGGGENFRRVH